MRYPRKVEAVCALTSEMRYSTKTAVSLGFIACVCACVRAPMCVCVRACVRPTRQNKIHLKDNPSTWSYCRRVSALAAKAPCYKPQRRAFTFVVNACVCMFVCVCVCGCVFLGSCRCWHSPPELHPLKSRPVVGLDSPGSHLHIWCEALLTAARPSVPVSPRLTPRKHPPCAARHLALERLNVCVPL